MNMPPESDEPALIARMQSGLAHVSANIVPLLRYQTATGSAMDREIRSNWMQTNGMQCGPDLLAIAPGAHASIEAALRSCAGPETVTLCESMRYPGIRAITQGLGLQLVRLAEDPPGILPDALSKAARRYKEVILYLNPTLRNPTTHTIPGHRRSEIATVLGKHGIPLIEDDAYHLLQPTRRRRSPCRCRI